MDGQEGTQADQLAAALREATAALNQATLAMGSSSGRVAESSPITSASAAREHCADMANLAREQFRVVTLDTRGHVMASEIVYQGTLNQVVIRPAEVFRYAVANYGASIILAHNHPSGDATPSTDDVAMTNTIIRAGDLLDIKVLDHLIIASGGSVSMREKGLGQWK